MIFTVLFLRFCDGFKSHFPTASLPIRYVNKSQDVDFSLKCSSCALSFVLMPSLLIYWSDLSHRPVGHAVILSINVPVEATRVQLSSRANISLQSRSNEMVPFGV